MTDDAAWKAFCDFARHPTRHLDPREEWEVTTHKPKPKQTRQRKMTLARALKQAERAGIAVSSATLQHSRTRGVANRRDAGQQRQRRQRMGQRKMIRKPKFVNSYIDHTGKARFYLRRKGCRNAS